MQIFSGTTNNAKLSQDVAIWLLVVYPESLQVTLIRHSSLELYCIRIWVLRNSAAIYSKMRSHPFDDYSIRWTFLPWAAQVIEQLELSLPECYWLIFDISWIKHPGWKSTISGGGEYYIHLLRDRLAILGLEEVIKGQFRNHLQHRMLRIIEPNENFPARDHSYCYWLQVDMK